MKKAYLSQFETNYSYHSKHLIRFPLCSCLNSLFLLWKHKLNFETANKNKCLLNRILIEHFTQMALSVFTYDVTFKTKALRHAIS